MEKLIGLFERLVVALETMAEAQQAIVRVTDVRVVEDPKPEPVEPEPVKEEKPETKAKTKTAKTKKEKTPEPVKEEKPKLTMADVKKAVSEYAKKRLDGGSADPKGDAWKLMAHFAAGAMKTDDIAEEYFEDVIAGCGYWVPVEEDL